MFCKSLFLLASLACVQGFSTPSLLGARPQQQQQSLMSSFMSKEQNTEEPSTTSSHEAEINQTPVRTPQQQQQQQQPSPELMMRALNTSPRRIFLSTLASTGIALSANFFGITSNLLNAIPEEVVESTGLDQLYPRGDFKRYRSATYGYSVVVPKEWVQDTAVELAKIQRRSGNLDYGMQKKSNVGASIPDVAYGPPGYFTEKGISQSDTNLSILATELGGTGSNISLKALGSPQECAEKLLRLSLTPEGSGKVGTLLAAGEEIRGASTSESTNASPSASSNVYTLEYRVDRGEKGVPLRAISVISIQDKNTLITMTVVAPAKDWTGDYEMQLRKMAESFKLTR